MELAVAIVLYYAHYVQHMIPLYLALWQAKPIKTT